MEKDFIEIFNEADSVDIIIDGENVPVGNNLLFVKDQIKIAIEVGSDLQAVFPPSSYASQYGANIILNPSAYSVKMLSNGIL